MSEVNKKENVAPDGRLGVGSHLVEVLRDGQRGLDVRALPGIRILRARGERRRRN